MRLWQKASSLLKDQNSIWLSNLSRRTALRNPDIEKAVIRATSHDEHKFDQRNIDRVCEWIRLSPLNLKPILWSISNRMEKTKNWIVVLKGLYLMHSVLNSRIPCVRKIGRLPFDLSNFKVGHHGRSSQAKTWAYNSFVRAYYAFLDQKSTLIFQHTEEKSSSDNGFSIMQELVLLQKLQGLIDLLVQVKPHFSVSYKPLVLDAMDGIIIEIYDIYSRICRGIAVVLMNIYSGGKIEAVMALNIVQKAMQQGEDLTVFFEFCKEIGVVNASEFPVIDRVPDEGIQELEQIISGFSDVSSIVEEGKRVENEEKAIVVREAADYEIARDVRNNENGLRTVITDKWERFDDDNEDIVKKTTNPFDTPLIDYQVQEQKQELPDLIIL